jgi:hypothetical protein
MYIKETQIIFYILDPGNSFNIVSNAFITLAELNSDFTP